ncbi:MAG: hypothetical protein KAJ40_08595, partial [Alphaproteobacteria bacterium]|nr:hypothetical protein [Alphaproteobacteria bacterium]
MLSETSSYGSSLGTSSMDNALQKLVGTSLISYINNNFAGDSYNLLAGHPAATGLKSVPLAITNQKKYNCDIMARVWQAAKCINFITDTDTDGFYTFQEYATDTADKRHLPTACTAITSDWNDNLVNALTSGAWTNDPVQTYFTLTEPEDCTGKACPCSGEPIPTGIKVISEAGFHEEHICLQPGCRYYSGIGDLAVGIPKVKPGCYGR